MQDPNSFDGLCKVTNFVWVGRPQPSADLDVSDGDINKQKESQPRKVNRLDRGLGPVPG